MVLASEERDVARAREEELFELLNEKDGFQVWGFGFRGLGFRA